MKKSFFLVFVIILLFYNTGIASAESVELSTTATREYTPAETSTINTANWTAIYYDTASYNKINDIRINDTGFAFLAFSMPGKNFNTTTFTITSGGTGTGVAYYVNDSSTQAIYWVFDSADTFTSSPITLSYDVNIFADITVGASQYVSHAAEPSSTSPVKFHTQNVNPANPYLTFNYRASVTGTTTDTYNVSYLADNYFTLSVIKGGFINDRWNITNADGTTVFGSGNMDKLSFNMTSQSTTGIGANISLPTGEFTRIVINATGCPSCVSITPPTADPITGVGMQFDAASYLIGGTANISWIRNNPTPFGYQDDIYITQPGGIKKILVSSPSDAGYVKTNDLPVAGTYTVSFERSVLGFFIEVLATDTATVTSEQASYIIVNESVPVGVYVDGTYLAGWSGVGRIVIYQDTTEGTKEIDSLPINGTCCIEFTVSQLFFPEPGNYRVVLMKGYDTVRATASVTAYFSDIIPGKNITVSNISLNKNQYTYGEPYTITYQVDSYNYSNKAKRIIAYEVSTGANTLINQVPAQTGTITRTFDSEAYPFSGALQLRLMGLNSTGDYLLAYVDFNLSRIDTEGYGLDVTKSPICTGETGYYTYYSPDAVNIRIENNDVNVYSKNFTSALSGKTVPFVINRVGSYEIFLRSSNSTDVKFTKVIQVNSCEAAPPTSAPMDGVGIINTLIFLATNTIIWTVAITLGLVVIVGNLTKPNSALPVVVTAWTSLSVAAIFGAFPIWIPIGMILIAIALIAAKIINVFNTGGGGQ